MTLIVNHNITLSLINQSHALPIFNMVNTNRSYLKQWLTFVNNMTTVQIAQNFVNSTMQQNIDKTTFAFVIFFNQVMVGRIGVYKIDTQNKIGEIGYWLVETAQGNGIIINACKTIINFCFNTIALNRIEIKCATQNLKSKQVPLKLNFLHEGVIKQGELLNGNFIDLDLFALLKSETKI